jgi:FAD/FMN-containing dehydrogenase
VHAGTDGTPVPRFAGEVLTASDLGYDGARRMWNGAMDRHPRYILRCTDAHDVAAGVRFARDHDLRIAVRGGGHSFAGLAVCDGGVVIDTSPIRRGARRSRPAHRGGRAARRLRRARCRLAGLRLPSEPVGDETRTWARRFHAAMGPYERATR